MRSKKTTVLFACGAPSTADGSTMTTRLSQESVISQWDGGRQLPLIPFGQSPGRLLMVQPDLGALLEAEEPLVAIQAVDRRDMYMAIVSADPELALEVMPFLSREQFVAIIDYEGWQDERLSIHGVIRWLDVYKQHGLDHVFRRFQELDEEYQTGLLAPYIDIVDEEAYEVLGHDTQDQYVPLPCNTLWYRVRSDDSKIQEFVDGLVQGGLGEDVAYIYSLLAHATYLPPNEQEELMRQFRRARLQEDGFALPEESRSIFMPFDGQSMFDRWRGNAHDNCGAGRELGVSWSGAELFLDAVLLHITASAQFDANAIENLQKSLGTLSNAIAGACQVQPDEVTALGRLLEHAKGLVSLGLEILSNGRADIGADILFLEGSNKIFRFALSVLDTVRDSALEAIKTNEWPGAEVIASHFRNRQFGKILWAIDQNLLDAAGFENTEMLKGLFNRLPLVINEVLSEDKVSRVQFSPVSRLADLETLKSLVESLDQVGRKPLDPVTESALNLN